MPIDVVVQKDARSLVGAAVRRKVVARLRTALRRLGRARSSATLVFTGDDEIRALNREFRGLDRAADTLSGGETQRIRLASQVGSGLSGVMYILDEPSIGLHQRDN